MRCLYKMSDHTGGFSDGDRSKCQRLPVGIEDNSSTLRLCGKNPLLRLRVLWVLLLPLQYKWNGQKDPGGSWQPHP